MERISGKTNEIKIRETRSENIAKPRAKTTAVKTPAEKVRISSEARSEKIEKSPNRLQALLGKENRPQSDVIAADLSKVKLKAGEAKKGGLQFAHATPNGDVQAADLSKVKLKAADMSGADLKKIAAQAGK